MLWLIEADPIIILPPFFHSSKTAASTLFVRPESMSSWLPAPGAGIFVAAARSAC
ncbi:hypothetical protein [Rhizobium leguminosarum]|uniref:hypothetical protein n=1 Tax=Rhizobium leguminosarum TaxID=384 RepID=UPI001AE475CE|nr:hypothetical protein [Rhizobium leguminosarum]MBP2443185.1 hypothetical protein [Rhizobium leguminosarum]